MQDPSALTRHIDARRRAESKCPDVVVESRRTNLQSDLDRPDIARFRKHIGHAQEPKRLVISNAVSGQKDGAMFAIEDVVRSDDALIESGCQGNQLKRRTGLV